MPTSQVPVKAVLAKGSQLSELKKSRPDTLQIACRKSPDGCLEFLGSAPADVITTDLFVCMALVIGLLFHQARTGQVKKRGKPKR